jgi:hypothetical protein
MPVIPTSWVIKRITVSGQMGKNKRPYLKNNWGKKKEKN